MFFTNKRENSFNIGLYPEMSDFTPNAELFDTLGMKYPSFWSHSRQKSILSTSGPSVHSTKNDFNRFLSSAV